MAVPITPEAPRKSQKPSCEQYRPLVAKYFPQGQINNALFTMSKESGCNPNAVGRTNDHGLFQINKGLAIHGKKIYDPEFNVRLAYEGYYKKRGWNPWYAVCPINKSNPYKMCS